MNEPNTKTMLDAMLASGKLSPQAAADLRDFQEDMAQDRLDPADAAYVEALAHRLGFVGEGTAAASIESGPAEDDDYTTAAAPDRTAAVLVAMRAAIDELCDPDRLPLDDPDRETKAGLHAALTARLDSIGRDFA